MRPATAAALHRINLAFYERHAAAFSATRRRPWPGWDRVLEAVEARAAVAAGRRLSVLDLGCGNARLASFLEARWRRPFDYLGVDSSRGLLEIARSRVPEVGSRRFVKHDLMSGWPPGRLPGSPFHLAAVFGLLHHVPGFDNRRALLLWAARRLAPGGLLAVSFWQFGERRRFRERVVAWEDHNRAAAEPIDPGDLEPGDFLLAWGEAEAGAERQPAVRYCHWTSPDEAERLLADLPLETVTAFRSDGASGDLNLYRLLRVREA